MYTVCDGITNLKVLYCAECTSIKAILIKAQLPWVAHVVGMDNHRMPCQLVYGERAFEAGQRKQGCSCKQ